MSNYSGHTQGPTGTCSTRRLASYTTHDASQAVENAQMLHADQRKPQIITQHVNVRQYTLVNYNTA